MEAPKITAARRQDHRVELRAGCMPEKKWHLRIHTAPCTNNAVRQPPSPQSRPTANLTSRLDPVPRHHRALPFQSTLSGLHCSGLAAALDWSSLSQHGGARVTRSVPRRRRWRCSRGGQSHHAEGGVENAEFHPDPGSDLGPSPWAARWRMLPPSLRPLGPSCISSR